MPIHNQTCHIIRGSKLTGKSFYIEQEFFNQDRYYVINLGATIFKLYGENADINNLEQLAAAYNRITQQLHNYLQFGEKDLVIEFGIESEEERTELSRLIQLLKSNGFNVVEIISDNLPINTLSLKVLSEMDPTYLSSLQLNDDHIELITEFLENLKYESNLN